MSAKKGIQQKIAVITGAAGGIGSAIATLLAKTVDALILIDLNQELLTALAKKLSVYKANIATFQCDVGDCSNVEATLVTVKKSLGTPNILINNAGIGGPFHSIDHVEEEEWDRVIHTNLKSIFNFSRILLPEMKKNHYGKIINIASIQGLIGAAFSSTYVASKHGVIGYTKAIAAEWGMCGITCNAICPGYVDTPMGIQNTVFKEHLKKVLNKTPEGRIASPVEIAHLVSYLLSDEAAFINGTAITIDGGLTCHLGIS